MAQASKESGYVDNWQTGKTVIECNLYMLTTEDCCDVIFRVGSEKHMVRAHRYVLVSRSCVFHAMFCGPLAEKGEVTIPDIEVTVFREFLRYLYTDTAKITSGNVTGLLYTSRKYAVDGLLSQCSHFLENSLSEENVCQILEQCHDYGEVDLEQKAFKILTEAGVQVIKSQGFLDLCETCLNRLITSEYLNMDEKELFEAVLSWSRDKCKKGSLSLTPENMRKYLGDMIYEIRFAALPPPYLVSVVGPSGILTNDERIKIMDRTIDINIDIAPFRSSPRTNSKRNASIFIVSRYGSPGFPKWGAGGWPEAISFSVNKDVQLHGCQLFGPVHTKESTYELNIILYGDKNQVIAEPIPHSQIKLRGQGQLNDVIFPDPIPIPAGPFYHICVNISGEESIEFGEEGKSFVKTYGIEFNFRNSRFSTSGCTTVVKGQIAGLIVKLMEKVITGKNLKYVVPGPRSTKPS